MKTNLKYTFIAGSSFAGGILAGLLLSARNENVQQQYIQNAGQWFDRYLKPAYNRSEETLQKLSDRLKQSLSNPVPDLYTATESFCLDEEDLMDD